MSVRLCVNPTYEAVHSILLLSLNIFLCNKIIFIDIKFVSGKTV